ncbi:MAG TPA: transglutaminase-like domain-containing protein [Pseudomonadales bacterium]|nr:transglutaminase-like domain-containing protein [Pseudomonadales bacterium]
MTLICLLLVALGACTRPSSDLESFAATRGERYFSIELNGVLQGRMVETRTIDGDGVPSIVTSTELALPGTGRTRRTEHLRFAAAAPHALLAHRVETRAPDGRLHARTIPPAGRLADHLGQRADGEGTSAAAAPAPRADGARVSLRLDDDGLPVEYRIGETFVLRRTDTLPELPAGTAPKAFSMATGARLGPRDGVETLTLRVTGPAARLLTAGPGQTLEPADGADTRTEARLATARLAPPAPGAPELRVARAVVATVRERLTYVPGASPPDLDALLMTGEGDCWEFAALFDALARRSALESRTVTGLAWMGDDVGAFGLHAWNEVRIDGAWTSIDPTFDQLGADAARIRFPVDKGVQLDLQYALLDSRIEVLGVNGERPRITRAAGPAGD